MSASRLIKAFPRSAAFRVRQQGIAFADCQQAMQQARIR